MWLVFQHFLCEISAWEFGILAAQTKVCLKGEWNMSSSIPGSPPSGDLSIYQFEQTQISFRYPSENDQKGQYFQYTSDTYRCVQGRNVACLTGISGYLKLDINSIYKHIYMYIKYRKQYLANVDSISRIFLYSIQYADLSALSYLSRPPWTFSKKVKIKETC